MNKDYFDKSDLIIDFLKQHNTHVYCEFAAMYDYGFIVQYCMICVRNIDNNELHGFRLVYTSYCNFLNKLQIEILENHDHDKITTVGNLINKHNPDWHFDSL